MKFRSLISLLFFLACAAVAPNAAWACGDEASKCSRDSDTEMISNSDCCSGEDHNCAQEHPADPCSEKGNCGGDCHCPHSTGGNVWSASFTMLSEDALIAFPGNAALKRQAFYFAEHLPEAVYLPIWQPPQIAA